MKDTPVSEFQKIHQAIREIMEGTPIRTGTNDGDRKIFCKDGKFHICTMTYPLGWTCIPIGWNPDEPDSQT